MDGDNKAVLNIVCISHWMSHCADGECMFMKQFLSEIGKDSQVDVLLSEEHPAFRHGSTVHARAGGCVSGGQAEEEDTFHESIPDGWIGRRVEEGIRLCKQSRNLYFYTNVTDKGGICEGVPPAPKLRKAEREWEQFLFSRNALQRKLLEELLDSLEGWKQQNETALPLDQFPTWFLKRLAFLAAHGRNVRDVILGKQWTGQVYDSLIVLVEQWLPAWKAASDAS